MRPDASGGGADGSDDAEEGGQERPSEGGRPFDAEEFFGDARERNDEILPVINPHFEEGLDLRPSDGAHAGPNVQDCRLRACEQAKFDDEGFAHNSENRARDNAAGREAFDAGGDDARAKRAAARRKDAPLGNEQDDAERDHDKPCFGHAQNVEKRSERQFETAPQRSEYGDIGPEFVEPVLR